MVALTACSNGQKDSSQKSGLSKISMHAEEAIRPLAMQGIHERGIALTLLVMHTRAPGCPTGPEHLEEVC